MGERVGVRTVVPKEILFEIDLVPGTWYLVSKMWGFRCGVHENPQTQEEPNFSPYLRVAQNNLNLAAHQGRQRYREFIRMERSRTDARHRPGAGGLAAFGSLAAFSGAAQGPAALRSLPDRGKKLALVRSHVERSSARR